MKSVQLTKVVNVNSVFVETSDGLDSMVLVNVQSEIALVSVTGDKLTTLKK